MSNQVGTQAVEYFEYLQWLQVDDGWLVRLGARAGGKTWFSSQFCPSSLRNDPQYTQWVRENLEEALRLRISENPTC